MANLSLRHVYKVYEQASKKAPEVKPAVSDFSMEIQDKEFIVFVGPSGCGKSTTLRMIAGLEEITDGEIYIDDVLVNDIPPKDRDIAMVFQNYALYPHMTVYDNMAFGLKMRKISKEEIDKKIVEAATMLGITEYLERKPKQLSGGQRQRVALGRALVRNPKVFLLDEPLSNLDAKLRSAMRTEITKLHDKLQSTFIYVTHDQVEAMTMGTRIVVMKDGFIQQIGAPQHLYHRPANVFVAGFIGTPQMNFFDGHIDSKGVVTYANSQTLILTKEKFDTLDKEMIGDGLDIVIGIRPDDIYPDDNAREGNRLVCHIEVLEELGNETLVYANCDLASAQSLITENSPTSVTAKIDAHITLKRNANATFAFDVDRVHLFNKETQRTLTKE